MVVRERSKRFWKLNITILLLVVALAWMAALAVPDNQLHVIACDVGQGDAFLLQHKSTQILIDGGPNNKVLDCLSRHVPFWDRKIELVILTHPQADHYTGLIEVFRRYDIELFLASRVDNDTAGYRTLKEEVKKQNITVQNPKEDVAIRLGSIYIDILWPFDENDNGVLGAFSTKENLNDFSIVFHLNYKDFDALFTGDIGPEVSNQIADILTMNRVEGSGSWEYLKVPHHGSKNGLTAELLISSAPEIAVISAGEKNRFGHPHKEVLDLLTDIKVLRTDQLGDVRIVTDGNMFWVER